MAASEIMKMLSLPAALSVWSSVCLYVRLQA